jgi:hypothetical protein
MSALSRVDARLVNFCLRNVRTHIPLLLRLPWASKLALCYFATHTRARAMIVDSSGGTCTKETLVISVSGSLIPLL